uniref:Uncharacterized protein n=1 Tax=Brassica oleracea var. oleracea TaxID=109376 RepID=A0A0D3CW52_BRAOL
MDWRMKQPSVRAIRSSCNRLLPDNACSQKEETYPRAYNFTFKLRNSNYLGIQNLMFCILVRISTSVVGLQLATLPSSS